MQTRLDFFKVSPEGTKATLALEWTGPVTQLARTHVPDDIRERVKPHFTDQEIADLTLLIIAINGWNRIAVSFRKMPG